MAADKGLLFYMLVCFVNTVAKLLPSHVQCNIDYFTECCIYGLHPCYFHKNMHFLQLLSCYPGKTDINRAALNVRKKKREKNACFS